ncbi:MAG: YcxB family protein [Beijerinckiaceae bacterium]
MTTESDRSPHILVRYSLTDEEVRASWRVSAARQQNAAGSQLYTMAYLGAFPIGLLGGFTGIAFGIDVQRFGGLVAALVGLGYLVGQFALHILGRRFKERVATANLQNFPEMYNERTIEITQDGFSQASSSFRMFYSWSMVRALTRHEQFLIFWMTLAQGVVVPRRALTPSEEAGILALAAQHIGPKA